MSQSIKVVLPDAGPLITLAHADALHLLLAFKDRVELVITDMVEFEVTRRRSEHADAQRIADFLARHAGRIVIQPTAFGRMAISAALTHERYMESEQVRAFYVANRMPVPEPLAPNCGELSINSYVTELIEHPPGCPCLIVAEDDYFLRSTSGSLPGNAHIISTATLLDQLEALDSTVRARDVLAAAARYRGREPNAARIDRPAAKVLEGSSWKEQTRAPRQARAAGGLPIG